MKRKRLLLSVLSVGVILLQVACLSIIPQPTPTYDSSQNIINTAVALTVDAFTTSRASTSTLRQNSPIVMTATPIPLTSTPTDTAIPPTNTPTPEPTATSTPSCDRAALLDHVTVADGTIMEPGTEFTKVWRLQNKGTCAWDTDYAVVFASGTRMRAESVIDMPAKVFPGQIIEFAVPMVAPSKKGTYRGFWLLRNVGGVLFGVGSNSDKSFNVMIKVSEAEPITSDYNLANDMCRAIWSNVMSGLDCPGKSDDVVGSAYFSSSPKFENGNTGSDSTIIVRPESVSNGIVRGIFPRFTVQQDDHFKVTVGCIKNKPDCDAIVEIGYENPDGYIQTLASWNETSDSTVTPIDLDLTGLTGQTVQFILTVRANGSSTDDVIFWYRPRIVQ